MGKSKLTGNLILSKTARHKLARQFINFFVFCWRPGEILNTEERPYVQSRVYHWQRMIITIFYERKQALFQNYIIILILLLYSDLRFLYFPSFLTKSSLSGIFSYKKYARGESFWLENRYMVVMRKSKQTLFLKECKKSLDT